VGDLVNSRYHICLLEQCNNQRADDYYPFCSKSCCFDFFRIHRQYAVAREFWHLFESNEDFTTRAVAAKILNRSRGTVRDSVKRGRLEGTTRVDGGKRKPLVSTSSLARLLAIRHLSIPCRELHTRFGYTNPYSFLNVLRSADYWEVVTAGYPSPFKGISGQLSFWQVDLTKHFIDGWFAIRAKQFKRRAARPKPVPKGYLKLGQIGVMLGLSYHTMIEYKDRGFIKPSYRGLAMGFSQEDIRKFVRAVFRFPVRFQVKLRLKLLEMIESGEHWLRPSDRSKLRLGTLEIQWLSGLSDSTIDYYLERGLLKGRKTVRGYLFTIKELVRCFKRLSQSKMPTGRLKAEKALTRLAAILPHTCR